jgi:hypothetical protein
MITYLQDNNMKNNSGQEYQETAQKKPPGRSTQAAW